jgi:RNA polymerase sigma-70 factor (ECF subfamily)
MKRALFPAEVQANYISCGRELIMDQLQQPIEASQLAPGVWNLPESRRSLQWRKSRQPLAPGSKREKPPLVLANEELGTVRRALVGDSGALSALFASSGPKLCKRALSVLRNKEDAEDAVQDALLSAFLKLRSFQGRSRFSTWLTRIGINAALMRWRKSRTLPQVSVDQFLADYDQLRFPASQMDDPEDPEHRLAAIENKETLAKRIRLLSSPLRSALHLRFVQQLSTREVAKVENVGISVIKSRLFRARKQLRAMLRAQDVNW